MRLLMWLIIGVVSGWLAGAIMKVKSGGWLKTMLIGVIGSVIGGCVMSVLGFYAYGILANIIVSVLGACLFLYLARRILN